MTNEDLQQLLRNPQESLEVELKQWMDPAEKVVQAKLAKELLALRNHGGGFLVIGFKDEHPPTPDPVRPADLSGFNTDRVNNIVKKYAEPGFHCDSRLVVHPDTGLDYPVIVVPGGAKVPVRCKADSPDEGKSARVGTYYIRRPGPESAPPQSGAEWDALLDKCLRNRQEELMALFGALLKAESGLATSLVNAGGAPQDPMTALVEFEQAALLKLESLQASLPPDVGARFPHGRYILSARIVGTLKPIQEDQLKEALSTLTGYTGWSPLHIFSSPGMAPYIAGNGLLECWLGPREQNDPSLADFWRVSASGFVTLVRGYDEDGHMGGHIPLPGNGLEVTMPVWRVGEFVARVHELGTRIAEGKFRLQLALQFEGLKGRKLFSHGNRRIITGEYAAQDPQCRTEVEVDSAEVDAALPALLQTLLTPLYLRFSFFKVPRKLFDDEVVKLLRREFA